MLHRRGIIDGDKVEVRPRYSIHSDHTHIIFCSPDRADDLAVEIVERPPIKPVYLFLELFEGGIQPPADAGGYLDPERLDGYIEQCLDLEVIPFSVSSFYDAKALLPSREKATDDVDMVSRDERIVSYLVPCGVSIQKDLQMEFVRDVNPRLPEEQREAILRAVRKSILSGYRPHILSFATSGNEGYDIFMDRFWPSITASNTARTVGNGFLGMKEKYDAHFGCGGKFPINVVGCSFGRELPAGEKLHSGATLETAFVRSDEREAQEAVKTANTWWKDIREQYDDESFYPNTGAQKD